MILHPIDVYCDAVDCERMTKASAVIQVGNTTTSSMLRFYVDRVAFPKLPDGTESGWTYDPSRALPALCPEHKGEG